MSAVRQIVVVGRDAEMWLSALALHRALSPAGISVEVIELPSRLSANDCYSAAPSLTGLHELLGLDRHDILRAASGIPVTGQRFTGWNETPFTYGYDSKRAAIANVDILQYWTKARSAGVRLPLERLSVAAVAANLGRVGPDGQSPADFGTVHRGYHLDGRRYASALKSLAGQRGIATRQCSAVIPTHRDERVEIVETDAGEQVAADLFVDASGTEAVLAGARPSDQFVSWDDHLPADRLALSSAPPLSPAPPFADIRATRWGWVGLFPLADRTAILAAFSSREHADQDVVAMLAQAAGTNRLAEPEVRALHPGMRTPWIGNVVSVGASTAAFPPLDLMQLHMAHVGITNLIALFPADSADMPEAGTYNGVVRRYAENVRDLVAAHYRLNSRAGQPLWDRARAASGPPNLDARLALFAARGLIPLFDEDSFDEGLWSNLLAGHGLVPRSYDLKVDRTAPDEVSAAFQRLIDVVDEKARSMPTVAAYLRQ